ncbi:MULTISPECIES: dihydroxyacetone kinase subunit DhaL [Heyndrickxia]|mgnify:CR=1 FL=1|uniref:phosphoenolpyruvate--glycerone phosphotransferase n=1 Tax=Heyndrickxia coagulans TaxID=1398 RepID=A0A150K8R3_HEYCO|nr:dihydroxyacetone kinase subunit DhaL [Heyndrickxia coagulans]AEH54542.1 dihydroxyacetone kinase, L subunit [Heyndrickxia coagulans 2-6]APB37257.1 dihydroxyacetone kinase subunit L [Heyndrickxia coagulans]KYC63908.1 Phosphoenolpyruvate-dihydroxyacetone phosphotransferase, ADP-binding subunit DhaL [Heyndrickxia coagulans]KYC65960.1 Phosphoenolpyruvate-dihydroxyacetone phosphotransferase, ADP-binding subunit DhaL [Heyndrickxia coagulans]QPG53058.1 dihydroxyacetone kinase subunit L [Heyndrickxi
MLTAETATDWLHRFAEKINENKAYLSELDSAVGDGDHGSNMARGVAAMEEKLAAGGFATVQDVLKTAAMALLGKVGGASGPLYGSALIAMAKQAGENEQDVAAMVKAGLEGIQKRGKAEKGEKTMVDVWIPACEALASGSLTKEAIQSAVEATKEMKATKGRASYLGERSIGHLDPGAVSSGYLFEALLEGGILDE